MRTVSQDPIHFFVACHALKWVHGFWTFMFAPGYYWNVTVAFEIQAECSRLTCIRDRVEIQIGSPDIYSSCMGQSHGKPVIGVGCGEHLSYSASLRNCRITASEWIIGQCATRRENFAVCFNTLVSLTPIMFWHCLPCITRNCNLLPAIAYIYWESCFVS